MTGKEITKRVNKIIKMASDPEQAHLEEDKLLGELVKEYAPPHIVAEIQRLERANFPRWCA